MTLRVLTYHRVAPPDMEVGLDPRLISATPEVFAAQVELIASRFQPVRLSEVVAAVEGRASLPDRAVLITFDDAYRDVADHAVPVLETAGVPAAIFVPTALVTDRQRSFWWDLLHRRLLHTPCKRIDTPHWGVIQLENDAARRAAIHRLRAVLKDDPGASAKVDELLAITEPGASEDDRGSCASWDELRALRGRGFELAGHTRNHRLLPGLPPVELAEEIQGCLSDLTREIGETPAAFCYPDGRHDRNAREALRQAGVIVAFGTEDGVNDLACADPLTFQRTNVTPRTSARLLRWRMTPWAASIDRWRHRRSTTGAR